MNRQEKKELEKENKLLKARNEELNENCYGLEKENEELKTENETLKFTIKEIFGIGVKDMYEPYGKCMLDKIGMSMEELRELVNSNFNS